MAGNGNGNNNGNGNGNGNGDGDGDDDSNGENDCNDESYEAGLRLCAEAAVKREIVDEA